MLRLRPYKKCDAKYIISWIKDETAFRKWCADRFEFFPISERDINAQYDAMDNTDTFFPMTAFDESGVVGHLFLRFMDEEKRTLRFGYVVVADTKRGMGYGKEMLELASRYAFDILKVEKITLGVFENNPAALYCYKAAGFQEVASEGIQYYNMLGEKWKCIEMEKTNDL